MSRMLGYLAPDPRSFEDAVGTDVVRAVAGLARLHADGWGTAWIAPDSGAVCVATGVDLDPTARRLPASWRRPAVARLVYLRFASRGAAVRPENAQPFARDGVAFQHNGLLSPREDAVAVLSDLERAQLRGTTDSEVYFAVAHEEGFAAEGLAAEGACERERQALSRAVRRLRVPFDAACLNALALSPSALHAVHAPGRAPLPLPAFAARGFAPADLPPGHDDSYNELRTALTADGVRVVGTTGIPSGARDATSAPLAWSLLPRDAVTTFPVAG
jgi:glutamine amidotransferase